MYWSLLLIYFHTHFFSCAGHGVAASGLEISLGFQQFHFQIVCCLHSKIGLAKIVDDL